VKTELLKGKAMLKKRHSLFGVMIHAMN